MSNPTALATSGEAVPNLSRAEAERLTEGIRIALDRTARGLSDLAQRVAEAYQRRADLALGYESWADYAQSEFGEQTKSLAAPIRRELVGYLSAEGMSTRAIAPAVSKDFTTVSRDIKRSEVLQHATPEPAVPVERVVIAEQRHVDITTGEIIEPAPAPTPAPVRKVTGLDGKTYTPPKGQPKQNRPALPGIYTSAIVELDKAIARIERLHADSRFNTNKKNVAPIHESDVQRAIDRLNTIREELTN